MCRSTSNTLETTSFATPHDSHLISKFVKFVVAKPHKSSITEKFLDTQCCVAGERIYLVNLLRTFFGFFNMNARYVSSIFHTNKLKWLSSCSRARAQQQHTIIFHLRKCAAAIGHRWYMEREIKMLNFMLFESRARMSLSVFSTKRHCNRSNLLRRRLIVLSCE